MKDKNLSVPDFLSLVLKIAPAEKLAEALLEENLELKSDKCRTQEECDRLRQENELLRSQLEEAYCKAIWDQDDGEITSIADDMNKRDDH